MTPLVVGDAASSAAQTEILASEILQTGFNCLVQMPTSSGKTWLAERAIAAALGRGGRAIYLAPLRALAAELAARWQGRFGQHAVGIFTGDYGGGGRAYPVAFRDARLLIMTPERLDACTRAWRSHWSWLPEVDVMVVDECHLLGEGRRGARLEGTVSRARRLNPFLAVLCFSATLGNRTELADWLDGIEYCSTWRPVPLSWRIVRYRQASEKPDLLAREIARAPKRRQDPGLLPEPPQVRRAELLSRGGRSLRPPSPCRAHTRGTARDRGRVSRNIAGLPAFHVDPGAGHESPRSPCHSVRPAVL